MEKIFAGITDNNELYFLEIEPKTEKHNYFSMSGFTVKPIKEDDAIKQVKEGLEDGEMWKQAVESNATEMGKEEWIEDVLSIDWELSGFDNSLLDNEISVNGENWLFESQSCGQHEEEELKEYFIDKELFSSLMDIWKKYHLKEENPILPEIPNQDIDELLERAILLIENPF